MAIRSEIDPIRQVLIHTPGPEHNYTLPKNTTEWIADESGQLIHNPDYLLLMISFPLVEWLLNTMNWKMY